MPKEFLEDIRSVKASIRVDDEFVKSGVRTRIALNNSAYGFFKGESENQEKFLKPEADKGYPLAKIAMEVINAYKTLGTPNLMINKVIDRLTPAVNNGNVDVSYRMARVLEDSPDYETQKRCVSFYIKAAKCNPAAMVRLGEIYEQGFYDVKPNVERDCTMNCVRGKYTGG